MEILQISKTIGKNIKIYRTRANMTQVQLAQLISIDKESVSRIELGKHNVSLATLERTAKILNIPVIELLREKPLNIRAQADFIAEKMQDIQSQKREAIIRILSESIQLCNQEN